MEITDAKVIAERLSKVRDIMKTECVDIYVVVTGDYHISEYAGDYFKEREFITGFTGSAGTAVITQNDARLFTDGRYFVQAEKHTSNERKANLILLYLRRLQLRILKILKKLSMK